MSGTYRLSHADGVIEEKTFSRLLPQLKGKNITRGVLLCTYGCGKPHPLTRQEWQQIRAAQ